jgi:TIR domain
MEMRGIDRHSLLDKIGRELQRRMTYEDIDSYLKDFGIGIHPNRSSYDSKWLYAKDLLREASPETIIRIADELDIVHGFTLSGGKASVTSNLWAPNHFRLFISHLSELKQKVGELQHALKRYGISAFVAHVDIEPTREWQDEIELALLSMDALAAILMPGFKQSNWTDQEVGAALGRGLLIIPIMRGSPPHGFIGKFQGLNADGKTVLNIADGIFNILTTSPSTQNRMLTCLVDSVTQAFSESELAGRLKILASLPNLPEGFIARLREGVMRSPIFGSSAVLLASMNDLLRRWGAEEVLVAGTIELVGRNDETPF